MQGECFITGKQRFATARAAYVAVQKAYWGRRSQKQPCRAYYCELCQGYHVTSHQQKERRRRRLQYHRQRLAVVQTEQRQHFVEQLG